MDIKCKKDRDNNIFVFYFEDKNEFKGFLYILEQSKAVFNDKGEKDMNELINKFVKRRESKCLVENYRCYTYVNEDEMAYFSMMLILIGSQHIETIKDYVQILRRSYDIC